MAWLWEGNSGSKRQEAGEPCLDPGLSSVSSCQTPKLPFHQGGHSAARAAPGRRLSEPTFPQPLPTFSLVYGTEISGSQLHTPCPSPNAALPIFLIMN